MRFLLTLVRNVLAVLLWPLRSFFRARFSKRAGPYVRLRIHRPLLTFPPVPPRFMDVMARMRRKPVHDVRSIAALLEQLAADPVREGLVLHVERLEAGWAAVGELRRALLTLRRGGKRVVVYLPTGGSERALYLASAADNVVLSPAGGVSLTGFAHQGMYLARLLEKIGLRVQVDAQGQYKTAAETLLLPRMSEGQREQVQALLNARHALVSDALLGRLTEGTEAAALFQEAAFSSFRSVELGLANAVVYEDGLPALLGHGERRTPWAIDAARYYGLRPQPLWKPLRRPSAIAVIALHGNITERSGPLGRAGINLAATTAVLRAARDSKRVDAVLLHINSPGGSALVSDLLHHEVERLAAQKPTVAYFADVAASGGYYIAAPTHGIVAAPEAITGSIGVISLKVVADDLLERAGITADVVRTAPHADMHSPARPLTPDERTILERESVRIYDRFIEVVASGRSLQDDAVRAVAGGRVWSAEDAQRHGLVDRVGGLEVALSMLYERLGVSADMAPKAIPFEVSKPNPGAVEGPPKAAAVLSGLSADLDAELSELAWLSEQRERVLCYCPALVRDCRG